MTLDTYQLITSISLVIIVCALASCVYLPKIAVNLDLRDIIVLLGIILISIGAYMIYPASAFIISGSLLFWIGRPR
jgi:hypothetical protein